MRGFFVGAVALALVALTIVPAASQTAAAKKELQTAFFHANELAQKATALAGVLTHVQHVINCLEGSGGKNFKPAAGVPCEGQGNGAIPDLQAAEKAGDKVAGRALRLVNPADKLAVNILRFTELDAAQPQTKVVAKQIKQALDVLK